MRTAFLSLAALLTVTSCAHRPYYRELVALAPAGEKELSLVLVDGQGQPMPNVPVAVGLWGEKVRVKTDAQGRFKLPVSQGLVKDNALVVVSAPGTLDRCEIRRDEPAPAPAAAPAVEAAPLQVVELPA
ncbi:MAG: carboxypeptidase regulatory-like domain-containing protein, partial [Deltaproteobacteria bacterium]|nr:carboxypeptidase regulatory-like domain-containing protein [Deltaproteobacteria bacterium]